MPDATPALTGEVIAEMIVAAEAAPSQQLAFYQPEPTATNDWHGKATVAGLRFQSVDRQTAFLAGDARWIATFSPPAALALCREVVRLRADQAAARELLLDANPLVFGADGTIDHEKPLAELVSLAAEKILHLRRLHAEVIGHAESASLDRARLRGLLRELQRLRALLAECRAVIGGKSVSKAERFALLTNLDDALALDLAPPEPGT